DGWLESHHWWTAAAHVGCGRPAALIGGARLRLVEPPAGRACGVKEGVSGGTMGSPTSTEGVHGGNRVSPMQVSPCRFPPCKVSPVRRGGPLPALCAHVLGRPS